MEAQGHSNRRNINVINLQDTAEVNAAFEACCRAGRRRLAELSMVGSVSVRLIGHIRQKSDQETQKLKRIATGLFQELQAAPQLNRESQLAVALTGDTDLLAKAILNFEVPHQSSEDLRSDLEVVKAMQTQIQEVAPRIAEPAGQF